MDFLKWYKNKIESGNQEPPVKLWNDIQNDLDIDMVYERLEKSLARDRQKAWIWRASSAAGILLILSLGYLFVYREDFTSSGQPVAQKSTNNTYNNDTISESSDTLILPTESIATITDLKSDNKEPESETEEKNLTALNAPATSDNQTLLTTHVVDIKTDSAEHLSDNISGNFEESQLASMNFSFPEPRLILISPESSLTHHEIPEMKRDIPKPIKTHTNKLISNITISAHGEIANTWLINTKTIEALNPNKLTATRPTFKQNYGFSMAGELSERWEAIGQLSLAKQNEQHYQEYYQGQYVSNIINLKYTDIAFKARYRPFRKDLNHALSAGIYMGLLDNAHQSIGGETINITSDYTNSDFGVIVGYQYFAPITDKISLAAGAFYRQGLKNIFAGNQLIKDNLNHSNNTSFNFTISLGYTFSL